MQDSDIYETPEIFELGEVSELTLGETNLDVPDCTDCTKKKDGPLF